MKLRKMQTKSTLVLRIRKRTTEISCTYNEEGRRGEFNAHKKLSTVKETGEAVGYLRYTSNRRLGRTMITRSASLRDTEENHGEKMNSNIYYI